MLEMRSWKIFFGIALPFLGFQCQVTGLKIWPLGSLQVTGLGAVVTGG